MKIRRSKAERTQIAKDIFRRIEPQERKKMAKMAWALHEWDCVDITEAIKMAVHDSSLRLVLVECGIPLDG